MVESRQIEKGRKGFMSVGREGGLLYSGGPGVRNMGNPVLFPVEGMDPLTPQRWRSGDKIRYLPRKQGVGSVIRILRSMRIQCAYNVLPWWGKVLWWGRNS